MLAVILKAIKSFFKRKPKFLAVLHKIITNYPYNNDWSVSSILYNSGKRNGGPERNGKTHMIEVRHLSKHYGEKKAVDDISFQVNEGEILGFLGPNGAGKSTTMNILTGYISSTRGEALIGGVDILEDPAKAKEKIGYLPEFPPLYQDMTVKEYLNFIFDLKKCKLPREPHLQEICAKVKISDVYGRVIKHLSKGYKQRVGLAQALVNNPPVLILDEPTVGLDPKQIMEIRSLIKRLGKHHTVILSSHILPEVQAVCDRIIIINRGKIAADDTAENLSRSVSADHKLVARIDAPREECVKMIRGISGVQTVVADMEREPGVFDYEIEAQEGLDIRRELFKRLAARNWYLLALRTSDMTLEDIFLKITMGDGVTFSSGDSDQNVPQQAQAGEPVEEQPADASENDGPLNVDSEEGGEKA